MKTGHKTNAMRLLDARHVDYTVAEYSPTLHSGDAVAEAIGQPAGQVFKTLVALVEPASWLLVMVPSDHELDLKRCAASIGAKRMRMATRKEAEAKTGLLAGGISPLALTNKPFTVYLDQHALLYEAIWVSAGQRGFNLRIAVADLLAVTGATMIEAVGS
jgi:Cys-tRNA(Pro)/Cys-tRNA(Cys) deacylase